MIAVDHLIFEYPGLRALDDVSFRIERGSITALTGPNGAGKTTLLRCMAALDQPISGAIRIDGIDVLEQPRDCHRIIGYLSDFFGLYQRLTVRQCLHYVARAQGIDEQDCDAAVADACKRLHILERLEMHPGELSRGLRQRVAIAQAIIHQPQVVLLDEPASGLDPEARHELAELFLDLQQQGMTLLVSSHILAELEAYCSDMLVLRQGRIVEQVAIKNRNIYSTPYKLSLATPINNLKEILEQVTGISLLKIENDQLVWLTIDGDAVQQHRILKQLLALDLPVCEFAPAPGNLQDAYLETIKQRP
ncbi:ABC transporter ATP-binding protein [Methylicorpusculum oleiharenae]|uniref:ABC transporter ATP-binding protein n=1 Tax=Methylicorpusculum oleiharenae TaxID=1338687 RepID=UPI0013583D89|nr:ABC transporter ATP-binding protein [Methylicorpusculum oleiharenae]MCD2449893.1 ABC transporter ATP-binding protein [Methylicorpusculum oleiharenae]